MTSTTRKPSATRKAPQDHQMKVTAPTDAETDVADTPALGEGGSITATVRGVDWTIEATALDDWDLLEELNDPTGASLPSATRRLLGEAQNKVAKDLVRDPKTRRVPATAMSELVGEIFTAVKSGNL